MSNVDLDRTARQLLEPGKGFLAADETEGTFKGFVGRIGIEYTDEEQRCNFRAMEFIAPGIEAYFSGVIFHTETLKQSYEGVFLPRLLAERGIAPGVKVDGGYKGPYWSPKEFISSGLDELSSRLAQYHDEDGVVFSKFRSQFPVNQAEGFPSERVKDYNARIHSLFAVYSQDRRLIPVVEPEVLMNGDHSLDTCKKVSEQVWKPVVREMEKQGVYLPGVIMKVNMVVPGRDNLEEVTPEAIARATLNAINAVIPPEIGIVFLSGGQDQVKATVNLNEINRMAQERGDPRPYGFSFGRALQDEPLRAWNGNQENIPQAQAALLNRARLVSLARQGKYEGETA